MNRALPAGLFLAWAIHDAEEWVTAADWARTRLGARMPTSHMRTAIRVMGVLVAGASLAGAATHGRSRLYRVATEAYGLHGVAHLLLSVAMRGYSPGVMTTPITVLPYALLATRPANRAYGPLDRRTRLLGLAAAPASWRWRTAPQG